MRQPQLCPLYLLMYRSTVLPGLLVLLAAPAVSRYYESLKQKTFFLHFSFRLRKKFFLIMWHLKNLESKNIFSGISSQYTPINYLYFFWGENCSSIKGPNNFWRGYAGCFTFDIDGLIQNWLNGTERRLDYLRWYWK